MEGQSFYRCLWQASVWPIIPLPGTELPQTAFPFRVLPFLAVVTNHWRALGLASLAVN